MNIAKKIFFISIFSLLFFVPNKLKAACAPNLSGSDSCSGATEKAACLGSGGLCSWNITGKPLPTSGSCVTQDGTCPKQKTAEDCAKFSICKWDGPAPKAAASLPIIIPKIDNPTGVTSVKSFIGNIINAIFGFVGSIALLLFIYGGFSWMTAGGNAEKVKKSRDTLVWTALGLVFIFLSYAIASIVIKTLS